MARLVFCLLVASLVSAAHPAWAEHGYAQFGDMKYAPHFSHFDYVNPQAPKGGSIRLVPPTTASNYDKYNPFTLAGTAPAALPEMLFETLLVGTMDEPTTAYGLLAEDVKVAPDKLSVVFILNQAARFHNGDPVTAADVKYSFDRLLSKQAAPQYRSYFGEVKAATVLDERRIRFDFKRVNTELPLIVGSLPVFSRKWGAINGVTKPFDQIVTDIPIGSGPYKIGKVTFGRDITYERDPTYWARDLNVRKGMFNFDRVTYKLYSDSIARFEAFKANEFDLIQVFVAREWARTYRGKLFDSGQLLRHDFANGGAGDFQGFLLNLRLPKFQDVRVRQAIGLAFDYEWLNRQLFYNAYTRVRGYFVGSDFEAKGTPQGEELKLLRALPAPLPDSIFESDVPRPPQTSLDANSGITLRDNLKAARALLQAAGWRYRDGALRNATGEALSITVLDSGGSMARIVTPFAKNLEKLGIVMNYKVIDAALLQKRMQVFDYEMSSSRITGSEAPGIELTERFGSRAADTEGSNNILGLKNANIDALLDRVTAAKTKPELVASVRALDRVLRFGYYTVPHWYSSAYRVAWRAGLFERPHVLPRYYQPESWATATWWASPSNIADTSYVESTKGTPLKQP